MADGEANVALQAISQANSLFTFDIYKNLANGTDNLFFSPISIQVILALVFLGARGDTAKQLARGLRLPEDRNLTEDGASAVMNLLQDSKDVQLNIANRIFIKNRFDINEEFNNSAIRFKSGIEEGDFTQEQQARSIINSWVENKTNHKIKNLIPQGVLDDLTRIVLVNAIYFKGDWLKTFDKDRTSPAPFHVATGGTTNVDLMYIKEKFKYSEISELESQVLLLSYKGEKVNMMIILPRQQNGLQNLEGKLASINLQDILSRLSKQEVHVYLPKFKLEYKIELTSTLQKRTFNPLPESAELPRPGSTEPPNCTKIPLVTLEKSVIGVLYSLPSVRQPPPIVFKADHPFVFLILDQQTQTVLFAGRYSTPP